MRNMQKNRRNEEQPSANVVQKGNDIFLRIKNEWFTYNTLSRPLGSGAMGTVYLGRSCQTHEKVAIKRVIDRYADVPAIRERARLEASLLFRHRNLVEMIGYCEFHPAKGPIFIISKLVSGITLDKHVAQYLRNRPDFVQRICHTIYPVLDALEYLHSKNIIHMDIKPSNIMIENGSNIRLMDLGIAYTYSTAGLISASGLVGTAQYAAPEQIINTKETQVPINKTTDIYELGMTLYELLAGTNPFDCQTMGEILSKQVNEILPNHPVIPSKIMEVIWKATEKNQADRYQSVQDFKIDLQKALLPDKSSIFKNPIFIGCMVGIVFVIIIFLILI